MKDKSPLCVVAMVLLLIGGLNLGLVGLGTLIGSDLNVVNVLLGSWSTVEAVFYLLVGLSALKMVIGIATGKHCKGGSCD